jgi:ABC-type transport system involved in multi-copper enzyme maturation permease subunit
MLLVASILAGTLALFFSTFMNPLFTLLCTSAVLAGSAVLGRHTPWLLPAYTLMEGVTSFTFHSNTGFPVIPVLAAIVESIVLLAAAAAIFSRKDIAVSIE